MSDKIKPHHLERKAILYIRQSSLYQVNRSLTVGFERQFERKRFPHLLHRPLLGGVFGHLEVQHTTSSM